jgi:hypothetical protein
MGLNLSCDLEVDEGLYPSAVNIPEGYIPVELEATHLLLEDMTVPLHILCQGREYVMPVEVGSGVRPVP